MERRYSTGEVALGLGMFLVGVAGLMFSWLALIVSFPADSHDLLLGAGALAGVAVLFGTLSYLGGEEPGGIVAVAGLITGAIWLVVLIAAALFG